MWFTDLLPFYLSIGISEEKIYDSTPKDLEPYELAHKIRMNERNGELYRLGQYFAEAINFTIGNMISEHKKYKYPEEPYRIFPMTEEEKELEAEKQLRQLLKFFGSMEENYKPE